MRRVSFLNCRAKRSYGDLATNAAMILAKPAQKSPRDLAAVFAAEFAKIDGVIEVEIAGPGFVNLRVLPILWARQIADIVKLETNMDEVKLEQARM